MNVKANYLLNLVREYLDLARIEQATSRSRLTQRPISSPR
jgi:hypothetical protein